jgi:hypothetical protein
MRMCDLKALCTILQTLIFWICFSADAPATSPLLSGDIIIEIFNVADWRTILSMRQVRGLESGDVCQSDQPFRRYHLYGTSYPRHGLFGRLWFFVKHCPSLIALRYVILTNHSRNTHRRHSRPSLNAGGQLSALFRVEYVVIRR